MTSHSAHTVFRATGARTKELLARAARLEPAGNPNPVQVAWERARGCTIVDVEGKSYLDFTSGMLVANVGHSHPAVLAAMRDQMDRLMHSYTFLNEARLELAEMIVSMTPAALDKVYLLTTGSEAVEAAIRAARTYTGKHEIVAFSGAFHGRTYMAASVTGKAKHKSGYGPLATGILRAAYPYCYRCPLHDTYPGCGATCFNMLDDIIRNDSTSNIAAVVIEPLQGSGGVIYPPPEYLQKLKEWCEHADVVLIFDEVQSGFGRTGKMFAFEHSQVVPNLLCVGKGISAGAHLSAVIGESRLLDALPTGTLTTTDGGNPLSCAAALAAIGVIADEGLCENAASVGQNLLKTIKSWQHEIPELGDVRGLGLSVGLEMVEAGSSTPAPEIACRLVAECCIRGLLVNAPTGVFGNVVALTPPLVIQRLKRNEH